ncbi:MAG: SET domain-containing protein-lysine N-methyltransferase [Cytophagaceae bacterium]|nr:SET domain-containing protein-lysine N-methyltransferase [Cytophagaceae bacterium]
MPSESTKELTTSRIKNSNPKLIKKEIAEDFFGVFTTEDIKEGEFIFKNWNDNCARLTSEEIKKLNPSYRVFFEKYSTEIQPFTYIGPFENEDVTHQLEYYINHCCDPNTWLLNDDDVVARRDIKAGEQITIDYATFVLHEFESSRIERCLCGAANCRGTISDHDWWKLREVYKGHFLSWIQEKINKKEESPLVKVSKS